MNRANPSEQGSSCRESPRSPQSSSGALTLPCFPAQPAIASKGLLLALALMHALLPRTPGLAPAAQAKAKDHQPLTPTVTPATSIRRTNQPCTGRTKNLGTPHHRAAPSPRLTSVPQTPILASSNLLNVWDMLESCKSIGHGLLSWCLVGSNFTIVLKLHHH